MSEAAQHPGEHREEHHRGEHHREGHRGGLGGRGHQEGLSTDQRIYQGTHQGTHQRTQRRAQQLAAAVRATAAANGHLKASLWDRTDRGKGADLPDHLCQSVVGELGAQGATLCVLFAPGMSVPVGVSDPIAARAEEVQFSAGEGPCWLAYATGEVVLADFTDPARAAHLGRLWPAYTPALRRQTGYGALVCLPLMLTSGLPLAFSVYAASTHPDRWWQAAPVVAGALRQVLDAASPPMAQGGPVWLDSSATLRRGAVWVAETLLVDEDPSLDPARALGALRTFAVVEGVTVDAAAAALVRGDLSAGEVLGRL